MQCLGIVDGRVHDSRCSCKSGGNGICKHAAALLFKLNDYKQSGKQEIEQELACTENPREWGVKKSRGTVVSRSFGELTFVKYEPGKAENNIE